MENKDNNICIHCEKIFSNKANRDRHVKNGCKKIRQTNEIKDKNNVCIYCEKIFSSKLNCDKHLKNGCKKVSQIKDINNNLTKENFLLNNKIIEIKNEKEELKDELNNKIIKIKNKNMVLKEELNKKIIEIKNKNEELKIKVTALETEIKLLREFKQEIKSDKDEYFKTISDIAKQPKNNNNILNYKNKLSIPFDLGDSNTIKEIQDKLSNEIEYKHLLDGQKSVAKFVHTCIILDEEGKNERYVCSDPSRGTFRFKDKDGNNILDIKARKLSKIVYSAIKQRILRIKNDFNNDDDNDSFDIDYLNKNINTIMNLMNDNTDFRNEMITLAVK